MGRRGRGLCLLLLFMTLLIASPASAANKTWAKIGNKIYNGAGKRIPGALTRGIDISSWQEIINWDALSAAGNVDFVFVRLMHGMDLMDPLFDRNMQGAISHGIPVGVYVYSAAESYAEALAEAKECIRRIRGYKISYPVVFDIEDESLEKYSREKLNGMAEVFLSEVEKAGYYPMLYCNQRWYTQFLDPEALGVDVWLARFADNITGPDRSLFNYTIWQGSGGATGAGNRSTRGLIPGIPISDEVDIDIGFVDYTKVITPRTAPISSYSPTTSLSYPYVDDGWVKIGEDSYFFSNGTKAKGWRKIFGTYYFFDEDGAMQKNALVKKGKKLYYVDGEGKRVSSTFQTVGSKSYYFGKNGKAVSGFQAIGSKVYFFDPVDFYQYVKQRFMVSGERYYAKKDGTLAQKKWVSFKEGGKKNRYYFDADCRAAVGLKTIKGKTYYFREEAPYIGSLAVNETVTALNGKEYVTDENGVVQ